MSKWLPSGPCAYASDDGRYMVNRSPQTGYPCTYILVKLGKKNRDVWENSEVVQVAHAADAGDRKFAMDNLMALCE